MASHWQFLVVGRSGNRLLMFAKVPPLGLFHVHTFSGLYAGESAMLVSEMLKVFSGRSGIVGREQSTLGFLVIDLLEPVVLADRAGTGDSRARLDGFEQSLEIGERGEWIGPRPFARGRHDRAIPMPKCRDCVCVADNELPPFEMVVEHLIVPVQLHGDSD